MFRMTRSFQELITSTYDRAQSAKSGAENEERVSSLLTVTPTITLYSHGPVSRETSHHLNDLEVKDNCLEAKRTAGGNENTSGLADTVRGGNFKAKPSCAGNFV